LLSLLSFINLNSAVVYTAQGLASDAPDKRLSCQHVKWLKGLAENKRDLNVLS